MSEVKRYEVDSCDYEIRESDFPYSRYEGEERVFVFASDYDALRAQNAELVKALQTIAHGSHKERDVRNIAAVALGTVTP